MLNVPKCTVVVVRRWLSRTCVSKWSSVDAAKSHSEHGTVAGTGAATVLRFLAGRSWLRAATAPLGAGGGAVGGADVMWRLKESRVEGGGPVSNGRLSSLRDSKLAGCYPRG